MPPALRKDGEIVTAWNSLLQFRNDPFEIHCKGAIILRIAIRGLDRKDAPQAFVDLQNAVSSDPNSYENLVLYLAREGNLDQALTCAGRMPGLPKALSVSIAGNG
jgi:hypothetical protein